MGINERELLKGMGFMLGVMKTVLQMNSSGGCMACSPYLMPIFYLEIVKVVHFRCVLPQYISIGKASAEQYGIKVHWFLCPAKRQCPEGGGDVGGGDVW